jgi:hypothetical protein
MEFQILKFKKVNFNRKYSKNHSFCATTLEEKHFTRINHKTQKPEVFELNSETNAKTRLNLVLPEKINKIDFINEVLESSLKEN